MKQIYIQTLFPGIIGDTFRRAGDCFYHETTLAHRLIKLGRAVKARPPQAAPGEAGKRSLSSVEIAGLYKREKTVTIQGEVCLVRACREARRGVEYEGEGKSFHWRKICRTRKAKGFGNIAKGY